MGILTKISQCVPSSGKRKEYFSSFNFNQDSLLNISHKNQ